MKFWNKRNKIEFFHHELSIVDNFPIIETKDLKLQWVKKARKDFENSVKNGADKNPGFIHLIRCPAIFDLFKYGYIVPLHKDVLIRLKQGGGFEWKYITGDVEFGIEPFGVSGFSKSVLDLIPTPPWSTDFIVKIDTGWNVIAPKGVKFLHVPIAYPDTFEFTATIGILNPALATQINFPLFWNSTDKETLIKAGTPLGHLIPLSEKKYQMVQRLMNKQDRVWARKQGSALDATFWPYTIRKKMVDMYNNYWHR
jgi:hypothetical protein